MSVLLTAEAEHRYIQAIFAALGASEEECAAVAEALTEGDLRGHSSHGLIRVPLYVNLLRSGRLQPQARPRIVQERAAALLMDGDRALGPYAALIATYEAMSRARGTGVAAVALYNCGHIGLAGYYVELAAREDLIGILFGKAEAMVHPYGGAEPLLGTNPISIAVPTTGDPVLLDMATSATSHGKLREAAAAGRPLPEGWAIDATGAPTTDPAAALRGALSPVGGAKGYGLALAVELLAGVLTGAGAGVMRDASGWRKLWGVLVIVLDPATFTEVTAFKAAVSAYLAEIKRARLAPGFTEILVPGERSYRTRRARLAAGIPIAEGVWEEVARLARELGVDPERYRVEVPEPR
jgi:LDH2 family malate/lactate/ureidoglycolate dehydrogenase